MPRCSRCRRGWGGFSNRDLKAAGIAKIDDRGRTIDVHALRHTFGTLLSAAGVAPRVAQAAMRHSSIDLTMNVYTDPRLLDLAGAVEALPVLPLSAPSADAAQATGTDDRLPHPAQAAVSPLAPMLAPTLRNRGHLETLRDIPFTNSADAEVKGTAHIKPGKRKAKQAVFRG